MPKYSIIIPIYNAAAYLDECLNSVLGQTYRDIEVVLIDDGSTDGSLQISQKYAKNDRRIRLIPQQNAGASAARNTGIAASTGRYIIFVDADDYFMTPAAIATIDERLPKGQGSLLFYTIYYEGYDKKNASASSAYANNNHAEMIYHLIAREDMNSMCNKVYDASIIKKHHIRFNSKIRIGEDLLFNIEYIEHCSTVAYLDQQLYFYRTSNQQSLTSTYDEHKYEDLMHVNDRLLRWADTQNGAVKKAARIIRLKNVLSCIKDLRHEKCTLTKRQKLRRLSHYIFGNIDLFLKVQYMTYMFSALSYSYIDVRLVTMIIKHHRWF